MNEIWAKLKEFFPEFEIHHTGGGIFVIRKDYQDLMGNNVMVAISDTLAVIMKNKDNDGKYISHDEFLKNEDVYWGEGAFDLEVVIMSKEGGEIKKSPEAEVFSSLTLNEIKQSLNRLEKIL